MSTIWGNTILRSDTDRVRKEDEIEVKVKFAYDWYMKNLKMPYFNVYFRVNENYKIKLYRKLIFKRTLFEDLIEISSSHNFIDFVLATDKEIFNSNFDSSL